MIFDLYSHIWTREYVEAVEASEAPIVIRRRPGHFFIYTYGIGDTLASTPGMHLGSYIPEESQMVDPERRLKVLDALGVDKQVLTLFLPGAYKCGPDTLSICRAFNDSVAKIQEKYAGRFYGVAQAPLYDMGEAEDEVKRAIEDLGLKGIQLFSDVDGKCLDSPELYPLYERMVKYDLPIWVQGNASLAMSTVYSKYRIDYVNTWDYDAMIAFTRMIMGGVLDRYPKLKFVTHHLAFYISYWMERLELIYDQPQTKGRVGIKCRRPPQEYFRDLYYDVAIPHKPYGDGLRDVWETLGANKLVLGADFPAGAERGVVWMKRTLDAVKKSSIPDEDKEKILSKNGMDLLRI